jgi:hypothetical protein
VKPTIQFRAVGPGDVEEFTQFTNYYPTSQFGGIVAYSKKGTMGVVGLDCWTPTSVMAHWYIKHPRCIMPLWKELNLYLAQYGRKKIIGSIPSDNVRCLRMIYRKLGWVPVARIVDGWSDGVDLVISECEVRVHGCQQQVAA